MGKALVNLLKYAKENNLSRVQSKLSSIILKYSGDEEAITAAKEVIGDKVMINVSELKSLLYNDKIDFPEYNIGPIGVERNE